MGKAQQLFSSPPPLPLQRKRLLLVTLLFLTWSITFTILSDDNPPPIKPTPNSDWLPTRKLTCTDSFWDGPAKCGLDGVNCVDNHPPNTLQAFQCPANCASTREGHIPGPNPHLAGPYELRNQPLVIGGPIYRGDSFICPAAVHAGVIDDSTGGCGVVKFIGWTNSFPAVPGAGGAPDSLEVKTYFPVSYRFTIESDEMACPATKGDGSWALPYVSAAHTALVWRASSASTVRTIWSLAVLYAHLKLRLGQGFRKDWVYPADVSVASLSTPPAIQVEEKGAGAGAPIPQILEPVIFMDSISNITFKWATESVPSDVEGISMLVDDVERARRYLGDKKNRNQLREKEEADSFFWQRTPQAFVDYIRFGYIKDGKVVKYSPAGVWLVNGTWTGIPELPLR